MSVYTHTHDIYSYNCSTRNANFRFPTGPNHSPSPPCRQPLIVSADLDEATEASLTVSNNTSLTGHWPLHILCPTVNFWMFDPPLHSPTCETCRNSRVFLSHQMVQLHFLRWTKKLAKGNMSEVWQNSYKLHVFRWNWTHCFLQKTNLGDLTSNTTPGAPRLLWQSLYRALVRGGTKRRKDGVMKEMGGRFIKTASYFERKTHTHTHPSWWKCEFFTQKRLWVRKPEEKWVLRAECLTILFSRRRGGWQNNKPRRLKSKGSALGHACLGFTGWHHCV